MHFAEGKSYFALAAERGDPDAIQFLQNWNKVVSDQKKNDADFRRLKEQWAIEDAVNADMERIRIRRGGAIAP